MYALALFACFVAVLAAQQLQDVTAIAGVAFQKLRIESSRGGKATCAEGTLPVQASAQHAVYQIPEDINQMAITQMFVSQETAGAPKMMPSSMATVSGTYDIHARLCIPSNPTLFEEHDSVQLLSHGIGFDSSYWTLQRVTRTSMSLQQLAKSPSRLIAWVWAPLATLTQSKPRRLR